jgi:hypothetical protein
VISARVLSIALLLPCALACATAPGRGAAPPSATADEGTPDAAPRDAASPTAPSAPEESPDGVGVPAVPSDERSWIEPLPALVLTDLTEQQQARTVACLEGHDVRSADPPPGAIMAAADCVAAIPAPGPEIRLHRLLVESHPNAPEAREATRRLGLRYEQIDVRAQAATAYAAYLRRYPTQADARALAQRAVCLARSLHDAAQVEALLTELERLYGRRGFSRPSDDALARLCAPLPPVAPGGH